MAWPPPLPIGGSPVGAGESPALPTFRTRATGNGGCFRPVTANLQRYEGIGEARLILRQPPFVNEAVADLWQIGSSAPCTAWAPLYSSAYGLSPRTFQALLCCLVAGLFVLPLAPWVLQLNVSFLEQFVIACVLGISVASIAYFVIGVVHGPLTLPVFLGIPAIVFALGCWRLAKRETKAR